MSECDLCDLPTPDPPVTGGEAAGTYCCRGCLEVARTLDRDADRTAAAGDPREALSVASDDAVDCGDADVETAFLAVSGMHCVACEAFLESRASGIDGIVDAEANYAAGLVRLRSDPAVADANELSAALSVAGYEARPAEADGVAGDDADVGRLLVGAFFGMMVMLWYVLFLYPTYLGVPPGTLLLDVSGPAGTYLLANIAVMSAVVLGYTGYPLLRGAAVSLRAGHPNMDLLVALAAVAAYAYSLAAVAVGGLEVYFDIVVAIVVVVTVGKHYEARIRGRATGHLADLAGARVETARRRTPAGAERVDVDELEAGDEVVVGAGDRVPIDGTVAEGDAWVDESLLTGEPLPRRREEGDQVVTGSMVTEGGIVVAVDGPGERTLDRLIEHLWSVQSGRPGVQRLADRLAAVFVPLAVLLAVAAVAWYLQAGHPFRSAVLTGLSVLVVSCPCALGLATPLAVSRGVRAGLRRGIVIADGTVFERAADVDVVALDKTGTLTTGEMTLRAVVGAEGTLERAAAVEQFATHPIAEAVAAAAPAPAEPVTGFEQHDGRGVSADVGGERVVVGRRDLLEANGMDVPAGLAEEGAKARRRGHLPAFVGWDGRARGLLVAGDRPRDGWADVVSELAVGREVVVITGDGGGSSRRFEDHPDVSEVFAGVPPEGKAAVVDDLRARGRVAMVGDGTNDASALAAADVGIALGGSADLTSEAADAVVTSGSLRSVPTVFDLTANTRRRVRWNLAWAFGYNAVAVPLALVGMLNPLLAAAAMAGSSLLVVGNSSRRLLREPEPSTSPVAEPRESESSAWTERTQRA